MKLKKKIQIGSSIIRWTPEQSITSQNQSDPILRKEYQLFSNDNPISSVDFTLMLLSNANFIRILLLLLLFIYFQSISIEFFFLFLFLMKEACCNDELQPVINF